MTTSFENDNDVIVYGLEKIITFARQRGFIFAAQAVWWLASIIGLEQGLIVHIDNLQSQEDKAIRQQTEVLQENQLPLESEVPLCQGHPERTQQILTAQEVSPVPRDLAEDQRLDKVLKIAEIAIEESQRARNTWQ
jgi:hypothetical protein